MSLTRFLPHFGQGLTRRYFLRSAISAPFAANGLRTVRLAIGNPSFKEQPAASHRLNYHPEGLYVWDIWFFTRGDEVHLIHLQKKRPGSNRPDRDDGALGHAVSTDLLTWTELPPRALPRIGGKY
jgi:hypothetical protein